MKLFHLVLWRISLALIVVLSLWAGFFYMKIVDVFLFTNRPGRDIK